MKNRNRKILFICALLTIVSSNYVMSNPPIGQPLLVQYGDGTGMLDFLTYYSGERASLALSTLGTEGTAIYTRLLFIDFIFIIGTAVFFTFLLQALCKWSKVSHKWIKISWLGYIRSGFDAIENCLILLSLHTFNNNPILLKIAGIVTLLKWLSTYLIIIAAILLVIVGIRNKIVSK